MSKLDDLTLGEIKQLSCLFNKSHESCANEIFEIGKIYVIRTVTMINIGRLVAIGEHELLLSEAAWIPDTGRYADFVKTPAKIVKECEPYEDKCGIGRGSIVDFVIVSETVRSQK